MENHMKISKSIAYIALLLGLETENAELRLQTSTFIYDTYFNSVR